MPKKGQTSSTASKRSKQQRAYNNSGKNLRVKSKSANRADNRGTGGRKKTTAKKK